MLRTLDNNPLFGNLVLGLIFGGALLAITLIVFNGHPQIWLYVGLSLFATAMIFLAATAHDRDKKRQAQLEQKAKRVPKKSRRRRSQRRSQIEYVG